MPSHLWKRLLGFFLFFFPLMAVPYYISYFVRLGRGEYDHLDGFGRIPILGENTLIMIAFTLVLAIPYAFCLG